MIAHKKYKRFNKTFFILFIISLFLQNLLFLSVKDPVIAALPSVPTDLLVEGQDNPTKVSDITPEFSAVYNDDDINDISNKYRIQVKDDTNFKDEGYIFSHDESVWDIGELPSTLEMSQAVVIGDYVYLFGGVNGSSTNIIYKAPVSNPTSWSDTGAILPSALAYSQSAIIGDYVYLFGGSSGSTTNVIYKAPISDPTSWSNTGATLPSILSSSQVEVIGDYVYLFGGSSGSTTNVIYKAPVSDPTSWSNTGATLPGVLAYSQSSVIGDYVYLFGGSSGSSTNVIYKAPVSDPTSWSNTGTFLPNNLDSSQLAVIDDYVYLFGGYSNGYKNVIYKAPVSDPTSWSNTGSILPGNLGRSQSVVIGNYVYLFGGSTGSTTNIIYKAPVSNPTSWSNAKIILLANLDSSQTAVIDDYVYLFGGYSNGYKNVIYKAPVSDPTSWSNTGSILPGNLGRSQTAVIGDYVYLFGGSSGSTTNVIYKAPVSNPTSWSDTGATLPSILSSSSVAVIGDYVYLFGGYIAATANIIYKAPVSDPTSWSDTGATLPGVLSASQVAVIGDYVYLFGGYGASYTDVIYKAPVSDPTSWSDTGSTLPGNLGRSQTAVIGDYVYLFGGYGASYTDVIYKAPVSDPTSWSDTGATLPGVLAYSQSAVIGDYVYLFGGSNGITTSVIYRGQITSSVSSSVVVTNHHEDLNAHSCKYKTNTKIIDDDSVWDSGSSGTAMDNCNQGERCADITYAGDSLAAGTTYYWRIKFWDEVGNEGDWSTAAATFSLNQSPTAPNYLLTEGQNNPVGVGNTSPEFSAIYHDSDSGDIANKYQIQVDYDDEFGSILWDSGSSGTAMDNCNQGERCADITYAGDSLTAGTTYYWRIKFWDEAGDEGDWSTAAQFATALNPVTIPVTEEEAIDVADLISSNIFIVGSTSPEMIFEEVTVGADLTFQIEEEHQVFLPDGLVISGVDESAFNIGQLQTSVVAASSASGLPADKNITSVLQWGIPGFGLQFSTPITITIKVDSQYQGQTLSILRSLNGTSDWTDDGIVSPGTCLVNTQNECIFQTTKASYFTPTFTSSAVVDVDSSSVTDSPSGPPSCNNTKPLGKPDLFQINVNDTQAILYYTPINNNNDNYYIAYGEKQGFWQHGVETNQSSATGALVFTINHLKPNTIYFFKIRGQNGCMPGDWGNEIKVKTRIKGQLAITSFYRVGSSSQLNLTSKPNKNSNNTLELPSYSSDSMIEEKEIKPAKMIPTPTPLIQAEENSQEKEHKKRCFLWWCW